MFKVLIVEDSPEDRVLYKRLLKKERGDFEVHEAESAEQGIAFGRDNILDCIIVDYNLPDADGIDFIKNFKKESCDPMAAIVMITGHGDEKTAVEAMKVGALDYITKDSAVDGVFGQTILNAVEKSRLRKQIAGYQKVLENSNQALTEFTHTVSHDLKAPLRRIASFCELLQEDLAGKLEPQSQDYMNRIITNAQRLQRFVDDLLEFSRVMHVTEEKLEEVDMNRLVKDVIDDLEPLIEEHKARITVEPLAKALVYPIRIRQLMMNLLTNAIKYHGDKTPVVRISMESTETDHIISVADNGMGIPEKFQESIFKAFQRLHSRDTIEGTGLGLSICKKVVDMHGGKIWLKSEEGLGTEFFVSLPREPKANEASVAAPPSETSTI